MIKYLILPFLALVFVSAPSFAESVPMVTEDPTYEERIELAKKMHELRPCVRKLKMQSANMR